MTAVAPPPASLPSGPNIISTSDSIVAPTSRRTGADPKKNITVSVAEDKQESDSKNKQSPPKETLDQVDGSRPPARPNSNSRSKFDLEPNVFEASFSRSSHSENSDKDRASPPRGTDATAIKHNALPPLSSLTSPAAADPTQFPWLSHSLRSGPLSPAMLAGPANGANIPKPDASAPSEGAFDPTTFRTGFTPGTGTGLTPGYNALMNGNFAALPMPSPNTAAFLNSITNATPLNEGADPLHAHSGSNSHPPPHSHSESHVHPPSAIPPHLQPQGMNPLGPPPPPQPTITPNTLNALTGAINDMNRAANQPGIPPGAPGLPQFYTPAMHPGAPHGIPPPGMQPPVDYAQQSANAASQAANGLFLLSQAHQELSKREEDAKQSTPLQNKRTSVGAVPPGSGKPPAQSAAMTGQKRKSDASTAGGTSAKAGKRGKKAAAAAETQMSPPKSAIGADDDDDDNEEEDGDTDRKPETEEEKRKNFLERNRQAALKCRQRKKAWLQELQSKVETLTMDNDRLQQTVQSLHDEVNRLTSILMQHRDCGLGMPPIGAYGRPLR